LVADDPLGPFRLSTDEFLVGDMVGSLYTGKLVLNPQNQWVMLASRMFTRDGAFVGALSDPFPVTADGAGRLSVEGHP
jgi:hypothetical protein